MANPATLGISCYYHDSAIALVQDGRVRWAVQEERLSRLKSDARFPTMALTSLRQFVEREGIEIRNIAYYEKPWLKFERILTWFHDQVPQSWGLFRQAMPDWLGQKLWIRRQISQASGGWLKGIPISFVPHHVSHAASAFFTSGWSEATVLTVDGVGEWATTMIAGARGSTVTPIEQIYFPNSLGLFYSTVTAYCGFAVNDGEYKVMGLASYARHHPDSRAMADLLLRHVVRVHSDGSIELMPGYFSFLTRPCMYNSQAWQKLLGFGPRMLDEPIHPRYACLAAAVQIVTEKILMAMVEHAIRITGEKKLCLAGGVALNCVANSALRESGIASQIWVPPGAGDAGGAVGAALYLHAQMYGARQHPCEVYLGPDDSLLGAESEFTLRGYHWQRLAGGRLFEHVADALASGKLVAWVQDRSEFGPRALGNRSLLADPREPLHLTYVNEIIKQREPFRPFAPSVLAEHCANWFETLDSSDFMLFTAPVKADANGSRSPYPPELASLYGEAVPSRLPAVTHVDGTARYHTVQSEKNPRFAALIQAFYRRTQCPVLLNTSLNRKGEPIVESLKDACDFFDATQVDLLVVGDDVATKA